MTNEFQIPRMKNILKKRGNLIVAYLLAGYPNREAFLISLKLVANAGVDIIEVGFPSANPSNDGQVIRDAHKKVDMSIQDDWVYWQKIRNAVDVPLWIMGYQSDLISNPRYEQLVSFSIADAFVIPGLDIDKNLELNEKLKSQGCETLGFVNGQMQEQSIRQVFATHRLIYVQLYVGETGCKAAQDDYEGILQIAKDYPDVYSFAGFGIDSPQRVEQLLNQGFDGVILGTAVIRHQNQSQEALFQFVHEIKSAANKEREYESHRNI